jgi:hypothetical protein
MGHISTNYKKKMKIILARRKSLKARRNCSRSTTRRKIVRLVILSAIRMQVQILTLMMGNPPRRVLSVFPSRRLHLYSTHLIVSWQKVNRRYAKLMSSVCKIDEFTYDDLVEMVSNIDDLLGDMKGKYKSLRKKHVSLQESYEELKTSHENLLDTHEKFKEAHSSHISQEASKVKVDVGITCDLLDDMSKIDEVSKSSISTSCDDLLTMPYSSNVDSCMNNSPCDPLLIIENYELRNIVDCLTKALANCHRGENTYNKMWEC